MNDYSLQQENELEALSSIFGEDFRDNRAEDPWKVLIYIVSVTLMGLKELVVSSRIF